MSAPGPPPATQGRGRLVPAVDDAPESLAFIKACVVGAGYTFISAPAGPDAVGILRRVVPRYILLDVEMAWVDGFETCREIRQIRELAEVPIIFLTARNSTHDVRAGMAAGGNDFVTKPFTRQALLDRLAAWTVRRVPLRHPAEG